MSRLLMVTWDGGGNGPPMLAIAASLRGRGHDVRFLGHAGQEAAITAAGFAFTPYRQAVPWSRVEPRDPVDVFLTFTDGGAGRDLEEAIAGAPADAVVVDCLMLGPLQAAEASGLPTVALVHSIYAFFGQAFPHSPATELGAPHGRAPAPLWDAATEVLVTSDHELDPAADPIPANVHWIGVAQVPVSPAPRHDRRRVLLSLSTVWFPGQQESTQNILDALAGMPVDVIATIDESIVSGGLRLPENVDARGFVPHTEVMPTVSLVIGHGGHATTMLALAHDLPLLIVPQHPMLDQPMIGQVLAERGAGLAVTQDASVEQIRDAITALLADDSYAEAAAVIGARLRATDGAARAADRIEALIGVEAAV
ncbi:MAG: glycosyltransferase [Acidimicrobiia bacterium]